MLKISILDKDYNTFLLILVLRFCLCKHIPFIALDFLYSGHHQDQDKVLRCKQLVSGRNIRNMDPLCPVR